MTASNGIGRRAFLASAALPWAAEAAVSAEARDLARGLVELRPGLRVLYFGNSRVEGPAAFCWGGLQSWASARGRLSGTAFSDPSRFASDGSALLNGGAVAGRPVREAAPAVQVNTWHDHGLILAPGERIRPAEIAATEAIPADAELIYTVLHRVGPREGTFALRTSPGGTAVRVDAKRPGPPAIAWTRVAVPPHRRGRTIEILCESGLARIYDLHVWSARPAGVIVGRMAVGGKNFGEQMRTEPGDDPRCRREDYVEQVGSFDPDVVIVQYGNNRQPPGWPDAARELLGRVHEARGGKPFAVILQVDNVSPRADAEAIVELSRREMAEVAAHEPYAFLVDPNPHLPADWPPTGKRDLGRYFANAIHENARGSRSVFEALIEALRRQLAAA